MTRWLTRYQFSISVSGDKGCYSISYVCRVSRPPEAQLIHTLSKFHCLIHELYPTNHHSPLEHAIYDTSCLLLAFLSPTTCNLSNLRSINLSPSPLNLSLSPFFLCWGFVYVAMAFPQSNSLEKAIINIENISHAPAPEEDLQMK